MSVQKLIVHCPEESKSAAKFDLSVKISYFIQLQTFVQLLIVNA